VTDPGETSSGLPIVASFESFYERQYASSVRLARALVGRWDLAEELAQDAFVELHRRWDRVSEYESPEGWIRRVVTHRAVSSLRRRSIEARLVLRLANERQARSWPADSDDEVWAAVAKLPKRQAQVTALTYADGLSPAEIADVLACDEATVRTHLRRARIALSQRLQRPWEES